MDTMRAVGHKLNDGEDEVLGLVEGVEDLILRDGDRRCTRDAAFYFEEAQAARARVAARDVIAQSFKFAIYRLIAQLTLDDHDNGAGASSHGRRIHKV